MNQSEAQQVIETRLTALYAGGLKIIRQNAPVVRQAESSRFAMFYVDPTWSYSPFLGGIKTRRIGLIAAELFAPIGEGNRTIVAQAEVIGDVFSNKSFSGIVCYGSHVRDVGAATLEDEDVRRYKIVVTIPYYYDKETA